MPTPTFRGKTPPPQPPPDLPLAGHAVIIGYGLPGRAVAETLSHLASPYIVIEANPDVVSRCRAIGLPILHGDGRDPKTLTEARVTTATLIAIMVPADDTMLAILEAVRSLNPNAQLLVRAHYTSNALKALHAGAHQVIAEEQVVAEVAASHVKLMLRKE